MPGWGEQWSPGSAGPNVQAVQLGLGGFQYDELTGGVPASGGDGQLRATIGTGTITVVADSASHPGVFQLSTGTVATNGIGLAYFGGIATAHTFGGGAERFTLIFKTDVASNGTDRYQVRAGFVSSQGIAVGSDAGDELCLSYSDALGAGGWQTRQRIAAGSVSAVDIAAFSPSSWVKAEFLVSSGASPTCSVYLNGTLVGSGFASLNPMCFTIEIKKSLGTTARVVLADMLAWSQTFDTRR